MKKRSERRKHCALAVVRRSQKFLPAAAPVRRKETALAVVRRKQKFRPILNSRGRGTAKI